MKTYHFHISYYFHILTKGLLNKTGFTEKKEKKRNEKRAGGTLVRQLVHDITE